jgi:hypothetical protein
LVEQCRQHQYIGGNIGSKMKILLVLWIGDVLPC